MTASLQQTSSSEFLVADTSTTQALPKPDDLVIVDANPAPLLTTLEFVLVFIGLALAVFLAALDQTIVAVALQAIANEFQSLDQINWIATGYFLTATAFIPVYGQLADIFG
ncbi:hypothetical protein HDU79_011026, partial [Rhizoclosmatium sp. JEL0117]